METKRLIVDIHVDNGKSYSQAVDLLNNGEVVAFPTETVYGLGAVATDERAVKKIFAAKGRPSDNPLIVHIGTCDELENYVEHISHKAKLCMDAFWPGPLTIIFRVKSDVLATSVTANLKTVGIRMPDHPVALQLLQQLGKPVAAPSANRSGKPSPTEGIHVEEDLYGSIPLILDGGSTGIGVESTVLDLTLDTPVILRPGGVTKEMLEAVIGLVFQPSHTEQNNGEAPKAPGMKYTHYAPNAPVFLIDKEEAAVAKALTTLHEKGHKVALLAPENFSHLPAEWFFTFGEQDTNEEIAANLYHALRSCDATAADIVLATTTSTDGVGAAIMNRLEKSAGGKWYTDDM
ncbi:threonylcarbamoyl-AMP synthase [Viridibacillus sp. YIM B01967]|uniref:Threonylcarbamoyl-AMP synthase n=1 Tax=Viridibacillus soli TaxID=2798301 RepID=A0ABS1H8L0_9BACL|nr:L-threonylcarbamoyladenylate synthase [Viridibacillus soli]MBK3495644.1 threonylcarbamoyl-AMP synthase [Viridibacillus soli]